MKSRPPGFELRCGRAGARLLQERARRGNTRRFLSEAAPETTQDESTPEIDAPHCGAEEGSRYPAAKIHRSSIRTLLPTKRLIAQLEDQRTRRARSAAQGGCERPQHCPTRQSDRPNPVFQQMRISLSEADARRFAARKAGGLQDQYEQLKSQAQ